VATIVLQRELTGLFALAGILGVFVFRPRKAAAPATPSPELANASSPATVRATAWPLAFAAAVPAAVPTAAWTLFAFFFKTGLLVFGSGLVVVSFVKAYVVDQYHWLGDRAFLDAVAVGWSRQAPSSSRQRSWVISLADLQARSRQRSVSFSPPFSSPSSAHRYSSDTARIRGVAGFVRGVTVAVVGVLAGTTYLVSKPVIGDWLTVLIAIGVLVAQRVRKGIPDQIFVGAGAVIGLIAYPLLRPTWMP